MQQALFSVPVISKVILMLLGWALAGITQATPAVELHAQAVGSALPLNQLGSVADTKGRALSITRLDLLLSAMSVQRPDGRWLESPHWHGFFRAEQPNRRQALPGVPPGRYQALRFAVGVAPQLNHADPNRLGPSDPLHPVVNGMHWGWTGGYIFLALEGHWQFDQAPRGTTGGYSYHLAGDPNRVMVELRAPIEIGPSSVLQLKLDALRLLRGIDIARDGDSTHSRSEDAPVRALKAALRSAFSLQVTDPGALNGAIDEASGPSDGGAAGAGISRSAAYPMAVSPQLPQLALPTDNPLTVAGVELGRRLFHDPRLSADASMTCASCHDARRAFSAEVVPFRQAANGKARTRDTMPLFNLAWVQEFFWDGRVKGLRHQAVHPIKDPAEMAASMPLVLRTLNADRALRKRFQQAFGGPATEERMGLALEQYLLTLVAQDSKFDRVQRGAAQLTPSEQRGLDLFLTEHDPPRGMYGADCFHCHGGGLFTGQRFMNNGLPEQHGDRGREVVTRDPADRGKFRTPSLRNVALTAPYMHDGRFKTLQEVVAHYDHGVHRSATLDPNLAKHPPQGLKLSKQDLAALVDYLHTLTDASLVQKAKQRTRRTVRR